jgi:Uma2 family endonuclease
MLQAKLAGRACIFVQDPLFGLDRKSEPEPDLIVVSGTDPEAYVRGKARPLLVIEVADSSLDYDREEKAPLYAEAGVPESWIVNLVDDVLEVYRDPRGTSYAEMRRLTSGESVSPLSWPDLEIDVTELIPSALGP